MKLENGRWRCRWCGTLVADMPLVNRPAFDTFSVPGKPTRRIVRVGGVELHRCEKLEAHNRLARSGEDDLAAG